METPEQVKFEEVVALKERLGISVTSFCVYLGISRSRYYDWKDNGIDPLASQFLRVFIAAPGTVIGVLSKKKSGAKAAPKE